MGRAFPQAEGGVGYPAPPLGILQTSLDVAGVQDVMCLLRVRIPEEFIIQHLDSRVVLRLAQIIVPVGHQAGVL